jgi:membrane protein DedA with SNARE-associated domain
MKMPGWQSLLWDGLAVLFSVPLMVGLGYLFADHLEMLQRDLRRIEHWIGALVILTIATYLLVRYRETWCMPRQEAVSELLGQERRSEVTEERR